MGIKQSSSYQYGFVREVKLSNKPSLEGYMHIYEYGMHQLLGSTNDVELGDCDDLFSPYYNKLGFNDTLGMYALSLRYNAPRFAKYLFQPQKLKREIADWLVEGDLHTLIINMIYDYPQRGKFEEALRKLEFRIIGNSIRSGIKDVSFWKADYIRAKLIISDRELNNYLASIPSPVKNNQKDPESQHHVFVPSDENMGANALSKEVETEGIHEGSRGNNTFININNGIINNYNNYLFNFTQININNQIVIIKTEHKIPGDNLHAEQPNETHSPNRQSEPHLSKDDDPTETQTNTNPTEEQSQYENIEETTDSQLGKGELREQPAETIIVPKKPLRKSKRGRKPAFSKYKEKSIFGFIDKTINPQLNVDTCLLTTKIMSILMNDQEEKTKAVIVVALEACKIIQPIKNGMINGFCGLLCKEHENLVKYKTFLYHYNIYEPLRKKAEELSQNTTNDEKLDDILKWKNVFNEMLENTKKSKENIGINLI